jgi:hydrogenase maturation protease
MSRLRILGIGSPSGDDQAGWLVVDALRDLGATAAAGIELEKLDRPGAGLVDRLQDADRVILVDAMQSGAEPGCIRRFGRHEWPAAGGGVSSHGFGLPDALALARELGCLPARLDLYAIEIGSALPGARPDPAIRGAARRLAAMIAGDIGGIRAAVARRRPGAGKM